MVTPYPPVRDGIASYALQSVAQLRGQGHDVRVLSPGPSAAHEHLDLVGPRGGLALAKRVRDYDRVVVQFHPDFFYPVQATSVERLEVSAALATAFRLAARVEVVVHEVDYRLGRGRSLAALAMRAMWRQVDDIVVHSETERRSFVEAFGVPPGRVRVVDHGSAFVARSAVGRPEARASLGIAPDAFVFLSIGFIQPHKGYDRAIDAFAGMTPPARLDVVGSVRVEEPDFVRYAEDLEAAAEATAGVSVHLGYVSDELFDRWILASDVVVLPYREIWSSGVMERARLLDRPVIATRVGALADQARGAQGVRLVADDAELRLAMREAAGVQELPSNDGWSEAGARRDDVQALVVARAAARRGAVPSSRLSDASAPNIDAVATAPLRRLHELHLPDPGAGRGLRPRLRRVVRRLTAWQLQPVVDHVNALTRASVQSVSRAADPADDGTGGRRGR